MLIYCIYKIIVILDCSNSFKRFDSQSNIREIQLDPEGDITQNKRLRLETYPSTSTSNFTGIKYFLYFSHQINLYLWYMKIWLIKYYINIIKLPCSCRMFFL